jgi:hypothetical protein
VSPPGLIDDPTALDDEIISGRERSRSACEYRSARLQRNWRRFIVETPSVNADALCSSK